MNKFLACLCALVLVISCGNDASTHSISITEDVKVYRFEQDFYSVDKNSLKDLKKKVPFLFPNQVGDSIWLAKINNEDEQRLFEKSTVVFPDFNQEKEALDLLFSHVKLYNPSFKSPEVITLITDLDYMSNVVYTGNYLFVALDMYLGDTSVVYNDFPLYLKQNYNKKQLVVDVASKLAALAVTKNNQRQFIDKMVTEGKKMYMLDVFLPDKSDAEKMGYSEIQLAWITENEANVWSYFIQQKLLYSTDAKLGLRFIDNAPFSKFYNQSDKDSPGRVGVWMGWQMVRSYMKNNTISVKEMLKLDADTLLKKSKYKPKK